MTAVTMAEHREMANVLEMLYTSTRFTGLTAPAVQVRPVPPCCIELHLHRDISSYADFEAWREALNIAPAEVERCTWDATQCLEAEGTLCGTRIRLQAYGPLYPSAAGSVA